MGEEDLQHLINGCKEQDRKSQKMLYKTFYGYAMAICLRYAKDRDDAVEVMNLGFFKVFNKLDTYNPAIPFKAWLGKIMVNVSIDFYRASLKHSKNEELDSAYDLSSGQFTDSNLNYEDLLKIVQKLPPAYKLVFNLYAIEGYTHEEIAGMLNINIGTSKSNLHKARQKLKRLILETDSEAQIKKENKEQIGIQLLNETDSNTILFDKDIAE